MTVRNDQMSKIISKQKLNLNKFSAKKFFTSITFYFNLVKVEHCTAIKIMIHGQTYKY